MATEESDAAMAQSDHVASRQIGAVAVVQLGAGGLAGHIQCQLGQLGHAAGDGGQIGLFVAVEVDQALHHQLAQNAQCGAQLVALVLQGCQRGAHGGVGRGAGRQQVQQLGVAAVQALEEAGVLSQGCGGRLGGDIRMCHSAFQRMGRRAKLFKCSHLECERGCCRGS